MRFRGYGGNSESPVIFASFHRKRRPRRQGVVENIFLIKIENEKYRKDIFTDINLETFYFYCKHRFAAESSTYSVGIVTCSVGNVTCSVGNVTCSVGNVTCSVGGSFDAKRTKSVGTSDVPTPLTVIT